VPEGDLAFFQTDGENTFSELFVMFNNISIGPTIIATIGLCIMLLWDKVLSNYSKFFKIVQGPLVAVVLGILYYNLTKGTSYGIDQTHLVAVQIFQ
jgi:lipid-binding SYLF domain-containing protein